MNHGYMESLVILLTIFFICEVSSYTKGNKTQRQILEELVADYDKNESPHGEDRTDVHVQLFINSFGSLNAANMEYSLDTFLRQRWNDTRLNYTRENRTTMTIQDEAMRSKIWRPDTFFENVKDAHIHQVTMPNILLRIDNNGDILYSMRVRMKLSCYMDFNNFPLDSQVCDARISSYSNTDSVIKYFWDPVQPIDKPENLEIAQFDLINIKTVEETYKYTTGNFSGLHVRFSLRRQNGYHMLQTYIPTILIVSISWVSFWLDPNAVPGRVTLGVTTLLTLTTLAAGIRQQLPPVSYVKAIDVWVGMCMIMVFGALLEFTFSNWLANRKIPRGSTPCRIPGCLLICSVTEDEADKGGVGAGEGGAHKAPTTYIDHARAVDRLCRGLFPGSFLVFNLCYWPYYLVQQHYTSVI